MTSTPPEHSPSKPTKRTRQVVLAVIVAGALGLWVGHEVTDDQIATVPVESHRIFVIDPTTTGADGDRQLVSGQDDDRTWTELGYPPRESDDLEEVAGFDDEAGSEGDRVPVVGVDDNAAQIRTVATTAGPDGGVPGDGDPEEDGGAPDEVVAPDGGVADSPDPSEPNATIVAQAGEPCGIVTCASGEVCCNASCGICTSPGESCHQRTCGMPYGAVSVSCGSATCNVGDLCCNPSCGICVAPGETCDPDPCLNPVQDLGVSETCGMSTCNVGEVCCNPSCGICTKPGEGCSREICD